MSSFTFGALMAFFGKDSTDANSMTFFEHLDVLRKHLIRSAIAIAICMIIPFVYKEFIFQKVIFGPMKADFPTYVYMCKWSHDLHLGDDLCFSPGKFIMMNTEVSGQFLTHFKVAMILGIVMALPYILWEAWRFVKPGLHRNEIRSTQIVFFLSALLYVIGSLFGYYIMLPFALNFLMNYQIDPSIQNNITIEDYMSFMSLMVVAAGLVYEIPVVVYFLARLGLIGPEFMRKYRRHAFVVIMILAALITPSPDIFSQLIVGIPMWFLYEISILVAARVEKKRKEREQEDEDSYAREMRT